MIQLLNRRVYIDVMGKMKAIKKLEKDNKKMIKGCDIIMKQMVILHQQSKELEKQADRLIAYEDIRKSKRV